MIQLKVVNEDITIAFTKRKFKWMDNIIREFGAEFMIYGKIKKLNVRRGWHLTEKMPCMKLGKMNGYPDNFDISNKQFVYVDDSYFSGNTVKNKRLPTKMNSSIKVVISNIWWSKIKSKTS